MKYYKVYTDDSGIKYSIDMIRVRFEASIKTLQLMVSTLLNDSKLSDTYRAIKYQQSFKECTYQHFFAIEYYGYGTVKIGLCMLGATRDQYNSGYIEFNPNRLGASTEFWQDFEDILSYVPNAELSRYDLAIDIPISRDKLMLAKDNREYNCIAKSGFDKTEYLGKRNKPGRVKLYNKQLEQGLDTPLSRLEITCDEHISIPTVLDLRRVSSHSDSPWSTS